MKKACKECPFRNKSAPGWLGEENKKPMDFRAEATAEEGYPCHMTVNQKKKRTQCIGAVAHATISCKRYRNPELRELQDEASTEGIMNVPEFIKHHTR